MGTNNSIELTIREICKLYNLADSTVRDWLDAGVFGDPNHLPTTKNKGRTVKVFGPKQIERLERFLLLRKWLGGELQVIDIVVILDDMDNPENTESAIEIL